jgi:hypothetical protein
MMSPPLARVGILALALVLVLGCAGTTPTPRSTALADQERQLEEFAQLRAQREKELSELSIADLASALQTDSERGLEPWNSLATAEAARRGTEAAPALAEFIQALDRRSFLILLAVRQINRDVYARLDSGLRVAILVDALANAEYFNAFGLPHLYWEEPAKAIIDEGQSAERHLFALLEDKRRAPMWGQEEVIESDAYQYRVADYALALIRAIRGEEAPLPADPAERDDLIRQL